MIFHRLLNPQGIAGLAVAAILGLLLIVQKVETRHWRKQSARHEALYRQGTAERDQLIAQVAAATERARAADAANARRVAAAQAQINDRSVHEYSTRIARARADARRVQPQSAAPDRGGAGGPLVPGLSFAAPRAGPAARADRLPDPDRLIATEQAIQLDELIRWVRAQAAIDPDAPPAN